MKTWNAPEVQELNINETAGGFWKVGVEGPYNIVFGKEENKDDGSGNKDTMNQSGEE